MAEDRGRDGSGGLTSPAPGGRDWGLRFANPGADIVLRVKAGADMAIKLTRTIADMSRGRQGQIVV